MNVLFVHNNFPGQYRHIAHALAQNPRMRVGALGAATTKAQDGGELGK
jgi:hypothetical protein